MNDIALQIFDTEFSPFEKVLIITLKNSITDS